MVGVNIMETNIAVVYFSGYGHAEKQAEAVEQGAKSVADTKVESLAIDKEGKLSDADWTTAPIGLKVRWGSR